MAKAEHDAKFPLMENIKKRQQYTMAEVAMVAAGFDSRTAFAREAPKYYQWAWRRNQLDVVCAHMAVSPVYSVVRWDRASVLLEAKKYDSRRSFKNKAGGAYTRALDDGYLDEACAHMTGGYRVWTREAVLDAANDYETIGAFRVGNYSAYRHAITRGFIDDVRSKMVLPRTWTRALVMEEAARHFTKDSFRENADGAYKHALRNGFLDEACAHMIPGKSGFNRQAPAVLYYLRISGATKNPLYKIGITNRDTNLRIGGMRLGGGIVVDVLEEIGFATGAEARAIEKSLHSRFRAHRYSGPPVMGNGNTELFVIDVSNSGASA